MEDKISKKEQEFILEKSQQNNRPNIYQDLEVNLQKLQEQNRKLTNENGKLKNNIEELSQDLIHQQNRANDPSASV